VAGLDYNETFAATAAMEAVRVFFAMVAARDLKLALLKEDIYVRQPQGFVVDGEEDKVIKLLKALYGLKQASREWGELIDAELKKNGFVSGDKESCLYVWEKDGEMVFLILHVDDMAVAAASYEIIEMVMQPLMDRFKMKVEKEPSRFVYFEIERNMEEGWLKLHQRAYIEKMLERFGFQNMKAVTTPAELHVRDILSKDYCPVTEEEKADMKDVPYAELVGALGYLSVAARLDISWIVGRLKSFSANAGREHWKAAKRVARYLTGTRDLGLVFRRGPLVLRGFADASYASIVDTRQSVSAVVFLLAEAAVVGISKRQRSVAQCTMEAETYALGLSAIWGKYLRLLFDDFRLPINGPIVIGEDNEQAEAFNKDSRVRRSEARHIDVKACYAMEAARNGEIEVVRCPGRMMPADIGTKPLGRVEFAEKRLMLGLH
jgi:hypothetical protein